MWSIGIMQGRLVPPIAGRIQAFPAGHWAEEFPRARAAGLASIEWIYETYGRDENPLCSDAGIERLQALAAGHGVEVRSVCADYFMEYPLVRANDAERAERLAHLERLLASSRAAGIGRIVIPFVDSSDVRTAGERDEVVETLTTAATAAESHGVELHLEMALGPASFAALLDRLPHRMIRVNYDSGNSAALGYRVADEFAAYGDRIGSVHVKDRLRGGGTVPLGTGSADLPAFFSGLKQLRYKGDVILQVARGETGREVEWARHNRDFVLKGLA
jgi:hexulose-6-phosphate isomerase